MNLKKRKKWERITADVPALKDTLGKQVDPGIFGTVVAFQAHGFPTSASCEGHFDHGEPFPWVEIYAPEPKGWRKSKSKRDAWTRENLKHQQRMTKFFETFYRQRKTPFDARLTFDRIGAFGGFRVQSFGAETMKIISLKNRTAKRAIYRKEMRNFTRFLKKKFMQGAHPAFS